VHQTPRKPGCYADHLTLSPGDPIPGSLCWWIRTLPTRSKRGRAAAIPLREIVKQEREPCLGPPSPSPGSFALPPLIYSNPCPGPGILTWFPFAGRCTSLKRESQRIARLCTGLTPSLRTGSPMFKCCSHGTFLHFGLQSCVTHLNICYYHQDLH